jgi:hypothetical protein
MSALSLAPRALYEEVAELLRQRIFKRELAPGSWIDELKIAEAYGISRTPLREALKVLAAEGLVTMKVRRGAYVTEVSEKDLSRGLPPAQPAGVRRRQCRGHVWPLRRGAGRSCKALHTGTRSRGCAGPPGPGAVLHGSMNSFHMRLLEIADNKWRTPDGGRPAQGDETQPA